MEADIQLDVSTERAEQIRLAVQQLKAAPWIADLKILVKELGREEIADNDPLLQTGEGAPRVFEKDLGERKVLISLHGTDLFFSLDGRSVFELSFLPKGQDFAVSFVDETKLDQLGTLLTVLEEDLKKAKSSKASKLSFLKK
jgi:hypothetical protein